VWQFKFVYCPQVLEICSVAHQPSCFGVGFSLCWFTRGLFLCLIPFLWGKVSDPSGGPLLSVCCDGLLIIFQFFSVVWLWILLTESGDELCGLLPALFQTEAYHLPTVGPSAFPAFVYWKFMWRSASCPCPFSSVLRAPHPLCWVFLFSSLFIVQGFFVFVLFFCRGGSQSAQGAMLVYFRCGWENTPWCLVLTCWSTECLTSRLGLGALLFSQCNLVWRSFPQAVGSGCQSFNSSWCFISAKCGSSISAIFLIYGA
jgi:hypothetical protein